MSVDKGKKTGLRNAHAAESEGNNGRMHNNKKGIENRSNRKR